jgi:site-specific DNA recombinase
MSKLRSRLDTVSLVVAGYVRRSHPLQAENYSIDAQKRAITDECERRGLPAPVFYEDDELSARSEQIAKRKRFKELLEDVEAGRVQIVIVHTLDRWSRNVMVTLQSFRILASHEVAFISLSEHIDYSTPEGRLQLTILAAFAAYFSDMLAKHSSKGKGERAAQGLPNGNAPFGYRRTGKKTPPERDPDAFPGLRMMGELRMQGMEAHKIADMLNEAGYRTVGKQNKTGLFTKTVVNHMLHNEFYAPYTPEDDQGTIRYHDKRFRGLHPAAFTYEEWQKIQAGGQMNYHAPRRAEQSRHVYEFAGYVADVQCGLNLRCTIGYRSRNVELRYYKDVARQRQLPCPAGGFLGVRIELVREQFGELLAGLQLPPHWHDEIRQRMLEEAKMAGQDRESIEREKERLRLKRSRILKQHRDGYIDDEELATEIAAVELLLRRLEAPEVGGLRLDEVIAAGERLPGMAALWQVATTQERQQMVTLLLEHSGLYYDLELKMIAALRPQPVFLPTLRMIDGLVEYEETPGLLVVSRWRENNPRLPMARMAYPRQRRGGSFSSQDFARSTPSPSIAA